MRTLVAGIVVVVVVVAVVTQLLLPSYLENRVQNRLEEGGGSAEVTLEAVPAVSLLVGRGRSFEARGSGLRFALGGRGEDPFKRLDAFARVEMLLTDVAAGPLRMKRFELTRDGRDEPYELTVRAATTPRELARELRAVARGSVAASSARSPPACSPVRGARRCPSSSTRGSRAGTASRA